MKITSKPDLPAAPSSKALNPTRDSDLLLQRAKSQKPLCRKLRNPAAGVRLKRDGASAGKRSRPETPLLQWNFNEVDNDKLDRTPSEFGRRSCRKRGKERLVSARRLAAVLWRLQLPEVPGHGGERSSLPKHDDLGFQHGASHISHHGGRAYGPETKDLMQSPRSVSGPRNGCKFGPSFQFSNAMEGTTKWDPICSKTTDQLQHGHCHSKPPDQQANAIAAMSSLQLQLEQAQARVHELENERQSSKKKLEHFLRKLSEERATWRSREHEKIRAIIDDVKADLNRERKTRRRLEILNSKLVNELSDVKLLANRYMQDYEKERKERELIEEVCDELAKEIGEDKAEVEALKRESKKLHEEVEDERKMLQMAEVWREERVQMKLVDAKVMLEEKYNQMSKLVSDLEAYLISQRSSIPDAEEVRKAEFLRQIAASVNIQEVKELVYEPPNPDDIFSVFDDINFGEANEREIVPCVGSEVRSMSPEVNLMQRHSHAYPDEDGDIEEDESGWETVTNPEDQGSSCSLAGSDPSVNKLCRDSNVSASGTDWEENACEETPIMEISEVTSVQKTYLKKVSSISRLWRSYPNSGENCRIISVEGMNGRLSSGASISPDRGSDKGRLSSAELVGPWCSPDSANQHITGGMMKGCIEWPRGMQKGSLKAKLLEARTESQKIQLRQVLKQKI